MNDALDNYARDNPQDVADGFVLLVRRERSYGDEETPWALFANEQAARGMAHALTPEQLLGGCAGEEMSVGDMIVLSVLHFKGGRRENLYQVREVEVTAALLEAEAAYWQEKRSW